jgi:hypothetical protein
MLDEVLRGQLQLPALAKVKAPERARIEKYPAW